MNAQALDKKLFAAELCNFLQLNVGNCIEFCKRHDWFNYEGHFHTWLKNPLSRAQLALELEEGRYITINDWPRLGVFNCSFEVRPVWLNHVKWRSKLPEEAFNFIMFLTDDEKSQYIPNWGNLDIEHVLDAFSYIRFYDMGSCIIITEIQNDVYGQIDSGHSRTRYGNWHRLLVLMFIGFVQKYYPEAQKILSVSSDFIIKRFPEINLKLANRLYEELFQQIGFSETTEYSIALEPNHQPKALGRIWSLDLRSNKLFEQIKLHKNIQSKFSDIGTSQ